jgi:hypothetical protein
MAKKRKRKRSKNKKILHTRILIAALAITLFLGVLVSPGCNMINDFESCAAAGNAVMESYPRQCRACDQTFMEKIERTDCTTDSDCIVFGRDGDCNCGCYRVGSAPVQRIEGCFCAAPTACECVNGECEGVFE